MTPPHMFARFAPEVMSTAYWNPRAVLTSRVCPAARLPEYVHCDPEVLLINVIPEHGPVNCHTGYASDVPPFVRMTGWLRVFEFNAIGNSGRIPAFDWLVNVITTGSPVQNGSGVESDSEYTHVSFLPTSGVSRPDTQNTVIDRF